MAYTSTHRSRGSRIRQWFLLFHRIHPPVFCEMQPRSRSPAGRDNEAGQPPAKSARSSGSASPRRVSPTQANANGCPSPAVSPPAEQPKATQPIYRAAALNNMVKFALSQICDDLIISPPGPNVTRKIMIDAILAHQRQPAVEAISPEPLVERVLSRC